MEYLIVCILDIRDKDTKEPVGTFTHKALIAPNDGGEQFYTILRPHVKDNNGFLVAGLVSRDDTYAEFPSVFLAQEKDGKPLEEWQTGTLIYLLP
jgi:hypothetical protein